MVQSGYIIVDGRSIDSRNRFIGISCVSVDTRLDICFTNILVPFVGFVCRSKEHLSANAAEPKYIASLPFLML